MSKKTILLVEDEPLIALAEKAMIEKHGYTVVTAASGEKALKTVRTRTEISLVLMDIDLGKGMDGTEAAQEILKDHELPIVFLTSHAEKDMVDRVKGITRYGYVLKNSGEFVLAESIAMAYKLFEAHRTIKEREERLDYMFDYSSSGIAIYRAVDDGRDFVLEDFNRAAERIDRVDRREIVGKPLSETFSCLEQYGFVDTLRRVWKTGEPAELENRYYDDGRITGYRDNIIHRLPSGEVVSFFQDATERMEHIREQHKAELKLRQEEENLRITLRSIGDAVISTDVDGRVTNMNPVALDLTGYTLEDARGLPVSEVFHIVDSRTGEGITDPVKKVLKTKELVTLSNHTRLISGKGKEFQISDSAAPILDDEGNLRGVVLVFRDVSEKYVQEQTIRESEERWRCLVENNPDFIAIQDCEGRFLYMNRFAEGYSEGDVIGTSVYEFLPEDSKDLWREKSRNCLESGEVQIFEHTAPGDRGEMRYYEDYLIPLYQGREGGEVLVVSRDYTELKESVKTLSERNKELEILQQASLAVMEYSSFEDSARKIFNLAKDITGGTAGYIALLSDDGSENEVLFLDDGGLPCKVDPNLPMPIRGLRAKAYEDGRAVVDNDFMNSAHVKFMPRGHVDLKNVLFAPLPMNGKVVGLMGLANKGGHFSERDRQTAEKLGTIAALALRNSRSTDLLRTNEASLKQTLEEKNFLMRELNHRVKNNLAMISSLIHLKSGSNGEKDDLQDLRRQIDAMRFVYDQLYRDEGDVKIDFRRYCRELLGSVFGSFAPTPVAVDYRIPVMVFESSEVLLLGLIINEVATNAIKHGFIPGQEARFAVELKEDGDSGYVLNLSNNGRPFPPEVDLKNPTTLGMRLISALVSQLDGTFSLQREPCPVFTIAFRSE